MVPARSGNLIAACANAKTTSRKIIARKIFNPRFGNGHAHHAATSGMSSSSQIGWKSVGISGKTPTTNIQAPENVQAPSFKMRRIILGELFN
jgi:hypothetical protein